MADNGIVWEEPPRKRSKNTQWDSLLAPLRGRPGEWARVREYEHPVSASNAARYLRGLWDRDGEYEFVSRKTDEGKARLYARYLGNAS